MCKLEKLSCHKSVILLLSQENLRKILKTKLLFISKRFSAELPIVSLVLFCFFILLIRLSYCSIMLSFSFG